MGKGGQRFRRRSRWNGQTRGGADLPTAADHSSATGAPDLPVSAARSGDRPAEPGLVRRPDLHSDAAWLPLSGGGDGLDVAQGTVLAGVEHDGCRVLPRSSGRGFGAVRETRDLQHRQGSQFTSPRFTGVLREAGIRISMDGRGRWMDQRVYRAALAQPEIRMCSLACV
jgi:hypothetical protein